MSVYADYNVENLKTPEDYLKEECDYLPDTNKRSVSVRVPNGWKVCELVKTDGGIELIAVTQGGVRPYPPEEEEKGAPFINYFVTLHTTPDRWGADARKFEQMVSSVRIGR